MEGLNHLVRACSWSYALGYSNRYAKHLTDAALQVLSESSVNFSCRDIKQVRQMIPTHLVDSAS